MKKSSPRAPGSAKRLAHGLTAQGGWAGSTPDGRHLLSLSDLLTLQTDSAKPSRLTEADLMRLPRALHTEKQGSGPGEAATRSYNWLTGDDGQSIRLMPLAKGGFSQIFVGLDQHDHLSGWRMLNAGPARSSRSSPLGNTPLSDIEQELRALAAVSSPLLPKRSMVQASEGSTSADAPTGSTTLYLERPLFAADLQDLIAPLHASGQPLGDVFAKIGRDLAVQVADLNKQAFLHRDLKPRNVLIHGLSQSEVGPTLQLADFGLATRMADVPRRGRLMGTLGFLPPEELSRNKPLASLRSDSYGLGMTLAKVFTNNSTDSSILRGWSFVTDSRGDEVPTGDGKALRSGLEQGEQYMRSDRSKSRPPTPQGPNALFSFGDLHQMVATHAPAVADLLFDRLLRTAPHDRATPAEFARSMAAIQAPGSEADLRATATLVELATAPRGSAASSQLQQSIGFLQSQPKYPQDL